MASTGLKPHWLDDLFLNGSEEPSVTAHRISFDPHFLEAVRAARDAYRESEEQFRKAPALKAPSPGQAARTAFLKSLG